MPKARTALLDLRSTNNKINLCRHVVLEDRRLFNLHVSNLLSSDLSHETTLHGCTRDVHMDSVQPICKHGKMMTRGMFSHGAYLLSA